MSGIRLSQKHGVNPSLRVCWWCGKDDGTVLLMGRLMGDAEAPRRACVSREPCPDCKEWHAKGITLVESADGRWPERCGAWTVIKESALERIIADEKLRAAILTKRVCLVEAGLLAAVMPKKEG